MIALLGALAVVALLGAGAFPFDAYEHASATIEWIVSRVMLVAMVVSGALIIATIGATLIRRGRPAALCVAIVLGALTSGAAGSALVLLPEPTEHNAELVYLIRDWVLAVAGTSGMIAIALLHTAIVGFLRIHPTVRSGAVAGVRIVAAGAFWLLTLAALAVFWAMAAIEIMFAGGPPPWAATVTFALIAFATGSTLLAVFAISALNRRARRRVESMGRLVEVALQCPGCGASTVVGKGQWKCGACGFLLRVSIEEPRCACGYLLFRLVGETCPECGRRIAAGSGWRGSAETAADG